MTNIATLEGNVLTDWWDELTSNAKQASGSIVSDSETYVKARAAALTVGTLLGVQPSITSSADGTYTLSFEGSDKETAVKKMNALLTAWKTDSSTAAEPKIKYNLSSVIVPVVLRQALPYLAIAAIGGGVGYYFYRQSKKKG